MFTGIILALGQVASIESSATQASYTIAYPKTAELLFAKLPLGASIACSGVCLTLIEHKIDSNKLVFEVSETSLRQTSIGSLKIGDKINLETSMALGNSLDGHIVLGHVDGVAELLGREQVDEQQYNLTIRIPQDFMVYCAPKGSIAIEGISLTINFVDDANSSIIITIIPHTLQETNLHAKKLGDLLNFEVDPLARYAKRILSYK